MIRVKRVYDPPETGDGFRLLVDRLWPRGLSKVKAGIDRWMPEMAPSAGLRLWFAHDPKKWAEFQKRYRAELREHADWIAEIRAIAAENKTLTLLYGSREPNYNNAQALLRILKVPR